MYTVKDENGNFIFTLEMAFRDRPHAGDLIKFQCKSYRVLRLEWNCEETYEHVGVRYSPIIVVSLSNP